MGFGRRRRLLLLTEEETSRLANAVKDLHVPRSFLIHEAIQAGLQTTDATSIPGRRKNVVSFRLPAEVSERVEQLAAAMHVSQQNLIRHPLFTYLTLLAQRTRNNHVHLPDHELANLSN